jgi:hypothetical protein
MPFPHCTLFPGQHATVDCAYGFTAVSLAAGVVSGNADVTCSVYQLNREDCHIQGSTGVTYTNPEGGMRGLLALSHSATLRMSDGAGARCPFGTNLAGTLTPELSGHQRHRRPDFPQGLGRAVRRDHGRSR